MKIKITLLVMLMMTVSCTKQRVGAYVDDKNDMKPGNQMENSADWYKTAVFYHIWVKSFSDGDYKDGIGDLRGIINNLDYIEDLGVTAIYLSPIFECAYKEDNMHGYDVTDYYRINNRFGTKEDLSELLDKAHKLGLRVIFDFIPNHTSPKHKWFALHPEYYCWAKENLKGWGAPWGPDEPMTVWKMYTPDKYYYSAFTVDTLADLNYLYKAPDGTYPVREEMNKILTYWLDRGFDGIRVDAVRYLVENGPREKQVDQGETKEISRQWRALLDTYADNSSTHPRPDNDKKKTSAKVMLGEIWTDNETVKSYFGNGDSYELAFDFSYWDRLFQAIDMQSADSIVGYWEETNKGLPSASLFANFESNHDNVANRPATTYANDRGKIILSAALTILAPGVPVIYYGNELGMQGAKGRDIELRGPVDWKRVKLLEDDENSILNWNRYLIHARVKYPSLSGTFAGFSSGDDAVLCVIKSAGDERCIVVSNMSAEEKSASIDLSASDLKDNAKLAPVIGDMHDVKALKGKLLEVRNLKPYATRIIYAGGKNYPSCKIAGDLNLK